MTTDKATTESKGFDPSRYLTKLQNRDYLEVKWRLVWLRSEHPDATIKTEIVAHTDQLAMFKAVVCIPGGGSAVGHGSETPQGFADYVEKAETKAIGRALGALGYGTQFTYDFESGERPVDSPVQKPVPTQGGTSASAPPMAKVAVPSTEADGSQVVCRICGAKGMQPSRYGQKWYHYTGETGADGKRISHTQEMDAPSPAANPAPSVQSAPASHPEAKARPVETTARPAPVQAAAEKELFGADQPRTAQSTTSGQLPPDRTWKPRDKSDLIDTAKRCAGFGSARLSAIWNKHQDATWETLWPHIWEEWNAERGVAQKGI